MRGFWGLMKAYWLSDRWREAWGLTAAIMLLTALSSKAGVWMAEASGSLVFAIAQFHHPDNPSPLAALLGSAGTLLFLVILKDAGFTGVRHLFSTTLHRRWRSWLDARFNEALLDRNHSHFHVQHGSVDDAGNPVAAPDNIDQRVSESIKNMTGGAIGLAMGIMGVVTSLFFVGQKLLELSTSVPGFEFLGEYGTAIIALSAVAIYVPLNTWIAVKLGGLMERLTVAMQRFEGSYRAELTVLLRRSFHVAASGGERVQQEMHGRHYKDIDRTWGKLNWVSASYMSFELIYNFVAARFVAYAPGLLPYVHAKIDLKAYVTGAELVNSLISQCSWFIHVMPAIATLRANAARVTGLAVAIERVQDSGAFYRRTGPSEFVVRTQPAAYGLAIRDLRLAHQGDKGGVFLTIPNLRFRPGEWTFVRGESGCGKTCLLKAINGLWPHGEGEIVLPEGRRGFYAAQDVKLPTISLKRLICLPQSADDFADVDVAAALHRSGLGELIEALHCEARDGVTWDQLLSGGQKQKLVLSRILLQRPSILFLDEATGALDPDGRVAFHQALRDFCPGVTVISVMHEATPPRALDGREFYDSVLTIANGTATKGPLVPVLPPQLTTLLTQVPPARKGGRPVRVHGYHKPA